MPARTRHRIYVPSDFTEPHPLCHWETEKAEEGTSILTAYESGDLPLYFRPHRETPVGYTGAESATINIFKEEKS